LLPLVSKERKMNITERPKRRKKLPPGRPKKAVKKEIITGTRFSKAEHFIVQQKAGKAGLKLTEYVRTMAIKGEVKSRMSEEDRHNVRQLVGMANNLNQLTKLAHQQGMMRVMIYFEEYRNQIDGLLKALKNGE
jgi:Bacterial mobilisation protein (MobC)